jgi:hypothetical protein
MWHQLEVGQFAEPHLMQDFAWLSVAIVVSFSGLKFCQPL